MYSMWWIGSLRNPSQSKSLTVEHVEGAQESTPWTAREDTAVLPRRVFHQSMSARGKVRCSTWLGIEFCGRVHGLSESSVMILRCRSPESRDKNSVSHSKLAGRFVSTLRTLCVSMGDVRYALGKIDVPD
jgi:hypothetical protein